MDPQPNQIPSFSYNAGTMDLGKSFASGLTAGTELGKEVGQGVSTALGALTQNRTADDTLAAMNQSGMLSNEAYQAVAGKSLGAKQALLGMHAGEWINQQAQLRALQQTGYGAAVDVAKTQQIQLNAFHQALDAIRSGYPAAAGIDTKKLLATPGATAGATGGGQPAQVAAPLVGPGGPLAAPSVTPQQAQQAGQMAGSGGAPTPLGSGNIYSPGPKLGAPIGQKDTITPGSTLVIGKGPKGEIQQFIKHPDGTLRPIQG